MNQFVSKFSLALLVVAFVSACTKTYEPLPSIIPVGFDAVGYALKSQNMLIILDAHSSMDESYQHWKKLDIATFVVSKT